MTLYVLDVLFVLLVIGILCAYRVYTLLRWLLDLRHRRRIKP